MSTPATPVVVARANCTPAIWSKPFSVLLGMARLGHTGLSVMELPSTSPFVHPPNSKYSYIVTTKDETGGNVNQSTNLPDDVMVLRGDAKDRALCHAQTFSAPELFR